MHSWSSSTRRFCGSGDPGRPVIGCLGFPLSRERRRRVADRFEYGEVRVYAIGLVNGIEITVIYSDRDPDERHIISAWKSEPHERRYFWNHLND
jgi:hypothetical protein